MDDLMFFDTLEKIWWLGFSVFSIFSGIGLAILVFILLLSWVSRWMP